MMSRIVCLTTALALLLAIDGFAQDSGHHDGHNDHQTVVDTDGVVMNENVATLPRDCDVISRDYNLTIQAGQDYAADTAGAIFGMSQHEVRVEPCSRVNITFVNEDSVRHQWMVHGLPKYLYPAGMFHIETAGGKSKTGTFIVPGDDQTFLIHCDMAQHMEMGMRGQLVVGAGSGNLWGIDGISDQFYRSSYLPTWTITTLLITFLVSFLISFRLLKRP